MANIKLADWIKTLSPTSLDGYKIGERIPFVIINGLREKVRGFKITEIGRSYYILRCMNGNATWNLKSDGSGSFGDRQYILWDEPI